MMIIIILTDTKLTFPFSVLSTIAVTLGKTDRQTTNVIKMVAIHTHIFDMMANVLVCSDSLSSEVINKVLSTFEICPTLFVAVSV